MKWVVLLTLLCLYQWKKMQTKAGGNNGCPNGFKSHNTDRCFYISSKYDTFKNALEFCDSQESELVAPVTCDTQNVLNTVLVAERRKCEKRRQRCEEFWIGLFKAESVWITSRGFDTHDDKRCDQWAEYHPRGDGRCVLMSYQDYRKRGTWQNADCAKELRYVCISCPDGCDYWAFEDECHCLIEKWMTWSEARTACGQLSVGAELLTIKSQMKQEAVARFLQSTFRTGCRKYEWASQQEFFWTGGQTKLPSDCKTPYVWKPVRAAQANFTYSHWYPGTPNCGYDIENCVAISSSHRFNYRWKDLMCNSMWCAICEF